MIVVKIRKPYLYRISWVPITEWVWRAKIVTDLPYTPPSEYVTLGYPLDDYNTNNVVIGSVFVDGITYSNELSESDVYDVEKSWFYDETDDDLYVHVDHEKRLDASSFDTQQIYGTSSEDVFYDEDGSEFLPFVTSGIKIRETADRLVYNKVSLVKQNLKFDNSAGDFDDFYGNPTPGSDVEYLFIPTEEYYEGKTALENVYVGYVSNDDPSKATYGITVQDKRAQLSESWPTATFTIDDYPDINEKIAGDIIPDGHGLAVANIPAIQTNGDTTSGNVTYRYGTLGKKASTVPVVEVEIDDVWTDVTVTDTNFDYDTCEFYLSATDGRDSSGKPYDARIRNVYLRYRYGDTIIAVLKDLMHLAGYPYDNLTWDTAKVGSEESTYLSEDTFFYTDEENEFIDYIEEIQGGGVYGFRMLYGPDRRWTLQADDIARAVSETYQYFDNISDSMDVTRDLAEYATSVEVEYLSDYQLDKTETVLNDTLETDVFNVYRVYKKQMFSSFLVDETDAEAKAELIAKDYAVARGQITFKLPEIKYHLLYDVVQIDTSVYDGIEKIREYLGVRKIKISYIEYDFDNETTTLRGYDITEV